MVLDYVQKLNIDSHHFQNPELQILQYLGPLYLVRLIHLKEEWFYFVKVITDNHELLRNDDCKTLVRRFGMTFVYETKIGSLMAIIIIKHV